MTEGKEKSALYNDPCYAAVQNGFTEMLDTERYTSRVDAFDAMISASHYHFWDPFDKHYIDFDEFSFDMEKELMMPVEMDFDFKTALKDELDPENTIKLVNLNAHWACSSALHGEQAALSMSASLCHLLRDPGAQEFAANQAREEARHVAAFSLYIKKRWGSVLPIGSTLGNIFSDIVESDDVWKKVVGIQLIVEGLAMGAFSHLHNVTNDKLLAKMLQLIMSDEAFHHKFGKIWARRVLPNLNDEEHHLIEDWAWDVFLSIMTNVAGPDQKKYIYSQVGLDYEWVQGAYMESMQDPNFTKSLANDGMDTFRSLVKTLFKSGIVTSRTAMNYSMFVDIDEIKKEADTMIGIGVAKEGIRKLLGLNHFEDEASSKAAFSVLT